MNTASNHSSFSVSSNQSGLKPEGPFYQWASAVYVVLGLNILISNGLLIYTYSKVKGIQSRHHLILALAISDLCAFAGAFEKAALPWIGFYAVSNRACTITNIAGLLTAANPQLTLLNSVYRLLGLKYPTKYAYISSPKCVKILYTVFFAYVLGLYWVFVTTSTEEEKVMICMISSSGSKAARSINLMIAVIPAAIASVVVNIILFKELKSRMKDKTFAASRDRKMADSIMLISAAYVLTFLCAAIGFGATQALLSPEKAQIGMYFSSGMVSYLGFSLNYYIYMARCPEFRYVFRTSTVVVPISGATTLRQ